MRVSDVLQVQFPQASFLSWDTLEGCGDGVLTKHLSDLVPNGYVLGIDSSQGMINTAKEIETSNLSFRQLNINDIDFVDKFDIIFF